MEVETEAAKVSANLKTAQDALRGKEGLIDGWETADAQKLVLSIENQALKASLAALASSPTPTVQFVTSTPIPTRTPTVSALVTSTLTPVRTTVGTQTTTPRSTATPTRTATPSQTLPPSSMDFQSATATAAALATLRSEVQAAQTAVSCDILLQDLSRAIERCSELNHDWVCYAARGVEVEPSNVRFNQPGDRAPLEKFTSIQTIPPGGVVVAKLQVLSEPQPFWLIAAQDSLYVLTN